MVKQHEKLAHSLSVLLERQGEGRRVFRSAQFPREDRERLLRSGYLVPIMRGWLMLSNPAATGHDTTSWYASFWEFCARYATHRFGERWHLSPELSLLRHAENTNVPQQVLVHATAAGNNLIALPFGTSLVSTSRSSACHPGKTSASEKGYAFTRPKPRSCACRSPSTETTPSTPAPSSAAPRTGAAVARRAPRRKPLQGGRQVGGGFSPCRTSGHRRRRPGCDVAHGAQIPGGESIPARDHGEGGAPTIGSAPRRRWHFRMQTLWESAREPILKAVPPAPGLPTDDRGRIRYLEDTDSAHAEDAYHSLSIEGYRVTPELIARVQGGGWNPEGDDEARQQRDALAAGATGRRIRPCATPSKRYYVARTPRRCFERPPGLVLPVVRAVCDGRGL